MFDSEDVEAIVQNFRRPVESKPLNAAEDIKLAPNDILMSYIMDHMNFYDGNISYVFQNMNMLNEFLNLARESYAKDSEAELPELPLEYEYTDPFSLLACAINTHAPGYFAVGFGDSEDGGLLAAKPEPTSFWFPSGKKVEYFNLTSEVSANVSILQPGYSGKDEEDEPVIYVRQNSLVFLGGLFETVKSESKFEEFRDLLVNDVGYTAMGIVLAREMARLEIEDGVFEDSLERELAVEDRSKEIIESNGIPTTYFKLYHKLMCPPEGDVGVSVSRKVLERL